MSHKVEVSLKNLGWLLGLAILTTTPALRAAGPACGEPSIRASIDTSLATTVRPACPEYRSWKRSLMPLVASQTLDVTSSWNHIELNPLLADSRGGFGMKAASIKFGAVGAFVAVQYLVVRRYPKAARVFSKMNWATAIATTGFAVHNYAIQ